MLRWLISFAVNRAMIALGIYLAYRAMVGPDANPALRVLPDTWRMSAPYEEIARALR